jgi:hypothetical protein
MEEMFKIAKHHIDFCIKNKLSFVIIMNDLNQLRLEVRTDEDGNILEYQQKIKQEELGALHLAELEKQLKLIFKNSRF